MRIFSVDIEALAGHAINVAATPPVLVSIGAVMFDLEDSNPVALSSESGSSVAAFVRTSKAAASVSRFYTLVDPVSCQREGFVLEADTVRWWLEQPEEARTELVRAYADGLPVRDALQLFWDWLTGAYPVNYEGGNPTQRPNSLKDRNTQVWMHRYDHESLASSFRQCFDQLPPWKYSQRKDLGTLFSLSSKLFRLDEPKREGVRHRALDDAIHQGRGIHQALRAIKQAGDQRRVLQHPDRHSRLSDVGDVEVDDLVNPNEGLRL